MYTHTSMKKKRGGKLQVAEDDSLAIVTVFVVRFLSSGQYKIVKHYEGEAITREEL